MKKTSKSKLKLFTPYMVTNTNFLKGVYKNKIKKHPVLIVARKENQYAFVTAKTKKYHSKWKKQHEIFVKQATNRSHKQLFKNDSLIDVTKIYFVNKKDFYENINPLKSNVIQKKEKISILKSLINTILQVPPNITLMELNKNLKTKNNYQRKIFYITKSLLIDKEWNQIINDSKNKISKEGVEKLKEQILKKVDQRQLQYFRKVLELYTNLEPLLFQAKPSVKDGILEKKQTILKKIETYFQAKNS